MKFESKHKTFHSRKCIWKCYLRNGDHFVEGEIGKSFIVVALKRNKTLLLPGSTSRQISSITHTKSKHLNVSSLLLQLPLPNPLKLGVKTRMKMQLVQRRQAILPIHLSDQQFYCLHGAPNIRGLTVYSKCSRLYMMQHSYTKLVSC